MYFITAFLKKKFSLAVFCSNSHSKVDCTTLDLLCIIVQKDYLSIGNFNYAEALLRDFK